MLYIIRKINKYLNKKITKFFFGIITSIYAYKAYKSRNNKNNKDNDDLDNGPEIDINEDDKEEENDNDYKNYEIMKKYCIENDFEFLLFDPKNNNFYFEEENTLKKINFDSY